MTDPLQLLFLFLFLSSWTPFLCDETITVPAGQNVTLECQVPKDDVITLLEWMKQKSDKYVFFFRDNNKNEDFQDERFLDRVQLREPKMKNGDVSVVLKNVNVNDSGTYECYVVVEPNGSRRVRREAHELKPVSIIKLSVTEPGTTDRGTGGGNLRGPFGLTAAAALFGVIVVDLY